MDLRHERRPLDLAVGLWLVCVVTAVGVLPGTLAAAPRATATGSSVPPAPPSDVSAPPADAQRTPSGLAMKVMKAGSPGGHPRDNDCVRVRFTAWDREGRFLFGSASQGGPQLQCLRAAMPGAAEALRSMAIGEERRIWLPASLTNAPGDDDDARPPRVDLTLDLELVAVIAAPDTPADLKAPPATALTLGSGVRLETLHEGGGGAHPSPGSRVRVHVSGWTLDGRLFESTLISGEPAVYLVTSTLPGWQEGLQMMSAGEKARFWIPAALAYGSKPGRPGVPTGDLVYDIELLAIEE